VALPVPPAPSGPRSRGVLGSPPASLGDRIRPSGDLRLPSQPGWFERRALACKDPPAWSPPLPDLHCCTLQDCRLQRPPGVWDVPPHASAPALAIGEREETLGSSTMPAHQLRAGTPCRRLVRALSLRPSWWLAPWAAQTEPRLSLPQAAPSGLPGLKSPRGLPDMTTAPYGELRRQDLHLQVQQLESIWKQSLYTRRP
jgi:hypothetical protein